MATETLSAPAKDGPNSGSAQKDVKYVPPHKRRKEQPQISEVKQWTGNGVRSLGTAAAAKDAQTSGKVNEAKTYRPPRRRSETEPETAVIKQQMCEGMENWDTAVLSALIDVMAREDSYWDNPGDVRGVIMYLPPKGQISGDLLTSVEDIEDGVFGHPVVILFASRKGDIETVYMFPVSCFRIFPTPRTLAQSSDTALGDHCWAYAHSMLLSRLRVTAERVLIGKVNLAFPGLRG